MKSIEANASVQRRRLQGRPDRPHAGKVIKPKSNLRWASNSFEIRCRNRTVVRVIFVIDTYDQKLIAWKATSGGFDGEAMRDLMLQAVVRRFGARRTPHAVEWLTDYGTGYSARETLAFAQSLGLVPCFTAPYRPESSGMAGAFIKTFYRDYVYAHDHPDTATVLARLERWFDDYNESHPPRV